MIMASTGVENANRLPVWLRQPLPNAGSLDRMRGLLRGSGLHTVCEGARCPNLGRCWNRGTATFMLLGDTCTRQCRFCAVGSGMPGQVNAGEPRAIAQAVKTLGLRYVVITSVTRDDLEDEGAGQFACTVLEVKAAAPQARVEVLIPDLHGRAELIKLILDANPDVIGHNIETVRRISPSLRSRSDYSRSLGVLATARAAGTGALIKSGLMVGLGETDEEVLGTLNELKDAGCDVVTIGQYLAPAASGRHVPVHRYVAPEVFDRYREGGMSLGIGLVFAGPLVRSSYLAEKCYEDVLSSKGKRTHDRKS